MGDGTVQCWGRNDHNDLGDGTTLFKYTPVPVLGIENATTIASGVWQACAVLADGTVKCWGANNRAELGNGTTAATPTATLVSGIDGITNKVLAVSPAEDHSCVLLADGSIRCFGENLYGELGDGKTVMGLVPVVAQFPKDATGVASGIQFTCALFGPASLQCLGKGASGQLGNGAFAQSPTPVVVSLPEGASVQSLAVKYNHICALGSEGELWCWGDNSSGQLGNGTTTNSNRPVEVPEPGVH
jgi:alpha-tubulin suppressor-like RCC1 family protein